MPMKSSSRKHPSLGSTLAPFSMLAAALVLVVLLTGTKALAFGKGREMQKMAKELNLTPDQKAKMKSIRQNGREEMKAKRDALFAAREDLENSLRGAATDEELKKKFEALQKIQQEMAQGRFEKVLAIRAILTPEQRAKFKSMAGEGMRHHGFGKGPGFGGARGHGKGHHSDQDDEETGE